MIIDDRVSSLDHVRIRRVAARLVKEAATGRQITIFTHNLLFFNEVIDAAAQASPAIPLVRNYINKLEAAGFGLISEIDEPWIAQAVTKRVDTFRVRLKGFDGVVDFTTDAWRRTSKGFYTDLSETWQKLVEEVLLGKIVERFNSLDCIFDVSLRAGHVPCAQRGFCKVAEGTYVSLKLDNAKQRTFGLT